MTEDEYWEIDKEFMLEISPEPKISYTIGEGEVQIWEVKTDKGEMKAVWNYATYGIKIGQYFVPKEKLIIAKLKGPIKRL